MTEKSKFGQPLKMKGLQQIVSDRPISANAMNLPPPEPSKEPAKANYMNIRINADDQSSCKMAMYWIIIFAAILLVSLLSGLALPHSAIQIDQSQSLKGTDLSNCKNNLARSGLQISCGSHPTPSLNAGQYITGLQRLNQFVVFYLYSNLTSGPLNSNENIIFRLFDVGRKIQASGETTLLATNLIKKEEIAITPSFTHQKYFYLDYVSKPNNEDQYYWEVEVDSNSQIAKTGYSLESYVVNPNFSVYCITLRAGFLALSILFFLVYFCRYMRMNKQSIAPEQKVVLFLSVVTITFNDPLYISTILSPNSFTSFLSTFFIWNFITTLFVIWAFFLKRINNEEGQITTNMVTCPNITLIVLFCLINLSYRVGLAVYQTSNRPFSDPNLTNSTYISTACAISSIVFLAALFYVFYLYCQIWNRRDELLWRSTLFVHISFFFFMLIFVLFLAGGFNVFQYSASTIMLTFTFTNIYSFFLQYMYMASGPQDEWAEKDKKQQKSQLEFPNQNDISIDISEKGYGQGYDVFAEYGASKFSDEEDGKAPRSYIGENLGGQGSKIIVSILQKGSSQEQE